MDEEKRQYLSELAVSIQYMSRRELEQALLDVCSSGLGLCLTIEKQHLELVLLRQSIRELSKVLSNVCNEGKKVCVIAEEQRQELLHLKQHLKEPHYDPA